MFRLRLTIDCHPRTKNGQPPQRTTGVARNNSAEVSMRGEIILSSGEPGRYAPMAASKIGAVSATLTQNRRVMLASSGFCSSSAEITRGSRAIPQIGHDPGSARTISGCIGQTYSVLVLGKAGKAGSSAIPHFGHAPGLFWCTSGSIGQMYSTAVDLGVEGAVALALSKALSKDRREGRTGG